MKEEKISVDEILLRLSPEREAVLAEAQEYILELQRRYSQKLGRRVSTDEAYLLSHGQIHQLFPDEQPHEALESLPEARPSTTEWVVASDSPNDTFSRNWNYCLSLLLKPDQAENIIAHLEEVYERDIKRYGGTRARFLYRKNVLVSLWPIMQWAIHRIITLEALKRFING